MNRPQVDIARVLASCALENTRITYPELSYKIGWHHHFGRGLGSHLYQVLNFCKEQSLPILTSILVQTPTSVCSSAMGGLRSLSTIGRSTWPCRRAPAALSSWRTERPVRRRGPSRSRAMRAPRQEVVGDVQYVIGLVVWQVNF